MMPRLAVIILAAGRSQRMECNKLMIEIKGLPMIRYIVDAALASQAVSVVVVVGHEGNNLRMVLSGRCVSFVDNPDYTMGLSTSLKCGVLALPGGIDGAIICLGDMPGVDSRLLDRMIESFDPAETRIAVVPTFGGKRGNPVLWGRGFFPDLMQLTGDEGAKRLITEHALSVREIDAHDDGILIDLDTPEALASWCRRQ